MFRKTITIVSLIGLILSLTAWGLSYYGASGSSYYYGVYISRRTGIRYIDLQLFKGRALGLHRKWQNGVDVGPSRWQFQIGVSSPVLSGIEGDSLLPRFTKQPTYYENNDESGRPGDIDAWSIGAPLYFPSLFFALLVCSYPVASHCRRRMRRKRGLCVKCGYDLRGSKEHCPECGRKCDVPKPVTNG